MYIGLYISVVMYVSIILVVLCIVIAEMQRRPDRFTYIQQVFI